MTPVTTETWLPVTGYEGLYEAGPGMVRSLDRMDAAGRFVRGRVLRPGVLQSGYHLLVLCKDGVRQSIKEHRVIAEAFHGPCPEGMEVCHRDGTKSNNHPDNLYYGTKRQNFLDSVEHGTHKEKRKTHCSRGHLLAEPNLVVNQLEKYGWRVCLACQKAHDRSRYHDESLQEMADAFAIGFGMIGK